MCAIVGGVLAQEIIKVQCRSSMHYPANINKGKKSLSVTLPFIFLSLQAISAKDRPYHNCFLYDGVRNTGIVEALSP